MRVGLIVAKWDHWIAECQSRGIYWEEALTLPSFHNWAVECSCSNTAEL